MLDGDDIPFADIRRNLVELEFINRYLGGHRITLKGFRHLLQGRARVSVCEIGCGGGDNLKAIDRWCRKHGVAVSLIGIDRNEDCVRYARENCAVVRDIRFIHADYATVHFGPDRPDIVFSSLFCHHLDDREMKQMWDWCAGQAATGFFINDLHRHPVAYFSIRILTKLFSSSYLVRNDAPLSVLRGFRKHELKAFAQGDVHTRISWQWAFRWLLTVTHERQMAI